MIVDRLEYASEYFEQLPGFQNAIEFIRENPEPGEGKHSFPGGFMMCQAGETKDMETGDYELHRNYIDVQILRSGSEMILWNRKENMKGSIPYDPEKDKEMVSGEGSILELKPGMFAVLFPTDAHKACRHLDKSSQSEFSKYVVKLEL